MTVIVFVVVVVVSFYCSLLLFLAGCNYARCIITNDSSKLSRKKTATCRITRQVKPILKTAHTGFFEKKSFNCTSDSSWQKRKTTRDKEREGEGIEIKELENYWIGCSQSRRGIRCVYLNLTIK